jgi:amino acid transporter
LQAAVAASRESPPLAAGTRLALPSVMSTSQRVLRLLLGRGKDLRDPGIFHRMALVPFLAWVGLGADGLSSSAYGPEEAFHALGQHRYLAVGLAVLMALTVLVISASYSQIIRHFPAGGGGYVVSTKLLGRHAGVTAGSALLIDYVLTIAISVASGADQVFSFLPPDWAQHKLTLEIAVVGLLVVMNLRGVKESVLALVPVFLLFLVTHIVLIGWGIGSHVPELPRVGAELHREFLDGLSTLGGAGMLLLFLRAYSLGGGTYTGIEAVSNGLAIMREPRVETGRRTMVYMAISLSVTAGGILLCYLVMKVVPVEGKTMNAVLAETVAARWPLPLATSFVVATLAAEAALLFVAAQAGFIDGPRVMANMASDSWLPHRFAALSDRLSTENGVLLMGGAALAALFYTGGSVRKLVVMYSINVFLTFSLSQAGMVRFWLQNRREQSDWKRHLPINTLGLLMCLSILGVTVAEKLLEGGWITLGITAGLVMVCVAIQRHYAQVKRALTHLDELFAEVPTSSAREELGPCDPKQATAVLFVGGYGGVGIHSLLTVLRTFPNRFANIVFVSIGVVDSGNFKGAREIEGLRQHVRDDLGRYVGFARRLGLASEYRLALGTDVVDEATRLAIDLAAEYPMAVFFGGSLIFEEQRWYHRLLHNETAFAIQHKLQFAGHPMMILPIRVRAKELA